MADDLTHNLCQNKDLIQSCCFLTQLFVALLYTKHFITDKKLLLPGFKYLTHPGQHPNTIFSLNIVPAENNILNFLEFLIINMKAESYQDNHDYFHSILVDILQGNNPDSKEIVLCTDHQVHNLAKLQKD